MMLQFDVFEFLFPRRTLTTLIRLTNQSHYWHSCQLAILIIKLLPWISAVKFLILDILRHLLQTADAHCVDSMLPREICFTAVQHTSAVDDQIFRSRLF